MQFSQININKHSISRILKNNMIDTLINELNSTHISPKILQKLDNILQKPWGWGLESHLHPALAKHTCAPCAARSCRLIGMDGWIDKWELLLYFIRASGKSSKKFNKNILLGGFFWTAGPYQVHFFKSVRKAQQHSTNFYNTNKKKN